MIEKSKPDINYALNIVHRAHFEGLTLRLCGSIAVWVHCPEFREYFKDIGRHVKDIDLAARLCDKRRVEHFLKAIGGIPDREVNVSFVKRALYHLPLKRPKRNYIKCDIFYDELDFCHVVPFSERIELDFPTLTPTDLFLEKLQIVEISINDLDDMLVIVAAHEISSNDHQNPDTISLLRLREAYAKDWGFYTTIKDNVQKLGLHLEERCGNQSLPHNVLDSVKLRLSHLEKDLDKSRKTWLWKLRSLVGRRVRWYNLVEQPRVIMQ